MFKKKSLVWVVAALFSVIAFLVLLYSPFRMGESTQDGVKKVYYVDNISEAHLRIIQRFNELNKGKIEVVPVNLPFYEFTTDDRKEILTSALRSRSSGIDVFAVDMIWIPRFAKWAYTLNNKFDERTIMTVDTLALKPCYDNDSLVAFPMFLDEGVLYYRKDLIRSLPGSQEIEAEIQKGLTWNEFISISKLFQSTHRSQTQIPDPAYVFPADEFEGMLCCFHGMLNNEESVEIFYPQDRIIQNQHRASSRQGHINLDTYPAERALQLMVGFIDDYKFSPPEVAQFDEYKSFRYAVSHGALFLKGWVGYPKQYSNSLSPEDTAKIPLMGIAPMPHFDEDSTSSVFGGWSLMVSKFSNRKEEALKFIRFMFEKENQEILYEYGGYLPINDSVYHDSSFLAGNERLMEAHSMLKWGRYRPFLQDYTRLSAVMAKYFHAAIMKEISVEAALTDASKQIDVENSIVK
jgi:multiple sugar transport system substrate-binding protein